MFQLGKLASITAGYLENSDPDYIGKTTQTGIDKRFTFYDQRHITGSDILQPKSAHAIMTVCPRVLLRDILQGALRMRQFMTSQKVHFIITESVRTFYCSKIDDEGRKSLLVPDLLTLGALNEDEKQGHENEKLAFGKIDAEIRAFVLGQISQIILANPSESDSVESIATLFKENRGLFIKTMREEPETWLQDRKLQNTAEILGQHLKFRLAKLETESSELEQLKERLNHMCDISESDHSYSLLYYLEPEIKIGTNQSTGIECMTQTQTLSLMDLDLDQFAEQNLSPLIPIYYSSELISRFYNYYGTIRNTVILKTIIETQPDSLKTFTDSVLLTDGNQIGVTQDLVQLYSQNIGSNNRFPIFSKFNLEGSHLLIYVPFSGVLENPGLLENPKVLLISPIHASKAYKDILDLKSNNRLSTHYWLCDLFGDVIITTFSASSDSIPVKNILNIYEWGNNIGRLTFDLLIFNGSLSQILENPSLKDIYYNEWLNNEKFKERATFLRLRMKALAEKDTHIFEDDDEELRKLEEFSMGKIVKDKPIIGHDIYAKVAVNEDLQSSFAQLIEDTPSIDSTSTRDRMADKKLKSIFRLGSTSPLPRSSEAVFGTTSEPVRESTTGPFSLTFFIILTVIFIGSCVVYFIFWRPKSHDDTEDEDEDDEDLEFENEDLESGKNYVLTE